MDIVATIPELLKVISEMGKRVTRNDSDDDDRAGLLSAARELVSALESPVERLSRMVYLEPTLLAIVRVAIDWLLYPAMLEDGGSSKSPAQLAQRCKVDIKLMSRALKHLAAGAIIKEIDAARYAPTPMVSLLCSQGAQGMVIDMCVVPQIVSQFPCFLKDRKYRNPVDKDDSPFMHAYGSELHYFEWLNQPGMEDRAQAFAHHMSFKDMGKKWYQMTDVKEIFDNPTDSDTMLMVDVGGNQGHDLIGFHEAYPGLPGRLMLQDLPAQISKIPPNYLPKAIEATAHDFFRPQPIQGAKIYYLHMILHDWPDSECVKILQSIVPAMRKGFSKILLNEIVIPDRGANWFCTSLDVLMMLAHAAQERTEGDWRVLLGKAGLEIARIWDCEGNPQKIIEVELM